SKKSEQDVKNYEIFHRNSPYLFPLKKEGLLSYSVNLIKKNLKPSTYKQYMRHIKNHHIDMEGSWNYKEFDPIINDGLNKLKGKSLSNIYCDNTMQMQIPFNPTPFLQNNVSSQPEQTFQDFSSQPGQIPFQDLSGINPTPSQHGQIPFQNSLGTNPTAYTVPSQLDQDNSYEESVNHIQEMSNLLNKEIQELNQKFNNDLSEEVQKVNNHLSEEVQRFNNDLSEEVQEFLHQKVQGFLHQKVQELNHRFNNEVQEFNICLKDMIQRHI
ncbi:902_t:CDS:2, partial [Gigaspora rosea]